MKIEDIDTNKNQRFLVKRLLGDLRRDVLSERLVSGKEFITRRQKVMLFLGFVPHKNWLRSFSVFSISGAAILFVIAGLGKIGEAETSGKQILGATTVGLEQMAGAGGKLSSRDFGSAAESLKQASESFKQARVMLAGGGAALSFFAKLAPSQVNLDDALYAANLASDSLARLSVMVEAFGDTRFGWDSASNMSFSWDTLELNDGGSIFLSGGAGSSLYVDNLILNAGSSLDLNGFNLYYYSLTASEGSSYFNGQLINLASNTGGGSQVPEPSTLLLLGSGIAGLTGIRIFYRRPDRA